jgi:hypothetical protein
MEQTNKVLSREDHEETETKVADLRMWCPNMHHVYLANQERQEEIELEKQLTSELIIKSEPECSDVEETQDVAENEDANQIQGNIFY